MKFKNKLKTAICFTAGITFIIHIINKIISHLSISKNLLSLEHGSYYEWRFGNIYYTKQGTGNPLLLVHNLDSDSSSEEWHELIKTLSKKNTVYTIDLLGCGRSDKPNITYTNYLYVQLITDFIKNIIGHKTDIIATGFSGSFAIMACHNDENLLNKIMLVNPKDINKLSLIPSKRTKTLKLILNTPIIGTMIYYILVNRHEVEKNFINEYFYNPQKITEKYISTYLEAAHLGGANTRFLYASKKGRYLNANIAHALRSINNSIYIIGSSNLLDNISSMQNYVFYNPSIETVFIDKTGLLPQLENPHTLLEHINVFFQ